MDVGLYDSDTGESLKAEKIVDVTPPGADDNSVLVFTRAQRGRIVQLQQGCLQIHYFMDEQVGRGMMENDAERFGFAPGQLYALAVQNAPRQSDEE